MTGDVGPLVTNRPSLQDCITMESDFWDGSFLCQLLRKHLSLSPRWRAFCKYEVWCLLECNCSVPIHASKYYYSSSRKDMPVSMAAGREWYVWMLLMFLGLGFSVCSFFFFLILFTDFRERKERRQGDREGEWERQRQIHQLCCSIYLCTHCLILFFKRFLLIYF